MVSGKARAAKTDDPAAQAVEIVLGESELDILGRVVHYYEKSMGVTRHIVRLTAPADVKLKYRFIVDEAKWLERFVETSRDQLRAAGGTPTPISFTPRALIAVWGRLLAGLNTPRSRRKLRPVEVEARQALADKLGGAVRALYDEQPELVLQEIATRRTREVEWMRASLSGLPDAALSAQ